MEVFIFPGQGSQRRGMGRELFDSIQAFKNTERAVDDVLGYSVRQMCLENHNNKLMNTAYTQPCLYVVNAIHYWNSVAKGGRPDFLVGHSLGEYNALLASGAFDFLSGLRLVKKRGELMAIAQHGAMAAIIGLNPQEVSKALQQGRFSEIDIANYNGPKQVTISGPAADIVAAAELFERLNVDLYYPLPVSAAFHSRFMKEAEQKFRAFLEPFEISDLKIPVISNVTGKPYPSVNIHGNIKELLAQQISRPVLWMQAIEYLFHQGAQHFTEVGPGDVLTRLVADIGKSMRPAIALGA